MVVKWSVTPENTASHHILWDAYPRAVGVHFSRVTRDAIAGAASTSPVSLIRDDQKRIVGVLLAGKLFKQAVIEVLKWMLASCKGRGLVTTPIRNFAQLAMMKKACIALRIPALLTIVEKQMLNVANNQIPLADVKHFYLVASDDLTAKTILIKSIGNRFIDECLFGVDAYITYGKDENVGFFESVDLFIKANRPHRESARANTVPRDDQETRWTPSRPCIKTNDTHLSLLGRDQRRVRFDLNVHDMEEFPRLGQGKK